MLNAIVLGTVSGLIVWLLPETKGMDLRLARAATPTAP